MANPTGLKAKNLATVAKVERADLAKANPPNAARALSKKLSLFS